MIGLFESSVCDHSISNEGNDLKLLLHTMVYRGILNHFICPVAKKKMSQ